MSDHVSEGEEIEVLVVKVEPSGRIGLSMKNLPGSEGGDDHQVAVDDETTDSDTPEVVQQSDATVEVGKVYRGTVQQITNFGAFVNILPGRNGLLHISEISQDHVSNVSDHVSIDEEIDVLVINVNGDRISLSTKQLAAASESD